MYNKVIMIGRLAADPELRTTPNGVSVASVRIAVNRTYDREKTDFFSVVAWRQNAEFLSRYFSKGGLIGVEGSLQTRDYTDREGNRRTAFEIQAERTFFVGPKERQNSDPPEEHGGKPNPEAYDGDDDLPF